MKEYDRNTVEKIGIPGMVLMERAALETFRILRESEKIREGGSAYILAGYGNNGGDGLALARLFCEAGIRVRIGLLGDSGKATESWRQQRKILEAFPAEFEKEPGPGAYDLLVDALFGVGLSRDLEGEYARAVRELNEKSGFKVALDVPSGVSSDDGRVLGTAFRADLTVTFAFGKRGLYLYPGCEYAGEVRVADIGIGRRAFPKNDSHEVQEPGMFCLEENLNELLPQRAKTGNKGTFGKALLIAGSSRMAGAAILCAEACYRIGAGMVKVLTDPDNRVILQERIPEALCGSYEDLAESLLWCDVICIGPGLGRSGEALSALRQVILGESGGGADREEKEAERVRGLPLVIDADGINLLAGHPELLDALSRQGAADREILLTPHMGEFLRLYGALFGAENTPKMQECKLSAAEYAMRAAKKLGAVVAAKDARTFVCREGRPVCLNTAGNSGMATAGSGDVLAGILTGLMAQGEKAYEAACKGTRIHGIAGDLAAAKLGEHGVMAGDIGRML